MGAGQGRAGNPGGGQPPTPMPPVNQNQPLDPTKMSDDELAEIADKWLTSRVMEQEYPSNLNFTDPTQMLIYALNWNDKPEILSSKKVEALAKAGQTALYRTIYANTGNEAQKIFDSILTGDVFKTSGNGERCYGGGAYFADALYDSQVYGNGASVSRTIGAVLNKNAKIIKSDDLRGKIGVQWAQKHPKAARAVGISVHSSGRYCTGDNDALTSMAVYMGYNVVDSGGYYTVLNRKALTASNKDYYPLTKNMSGGSNKQKG